MKRNWSIDELIDCWTLLPLETALLDNKSGPTRLGFALLFKFFQLEARFPNAKNEIPRVVVAFVARQVDVAPDEYLRYDWRGRTIKYHRAQIREYFGFREFTLADEADLKQWLGDEVFSRDQDRDHLEALIAGRCANCNWNRRRRSGSSACSTPRCTAMKNASFRVSPLISPATPSNTSMS